MGSGYGTPLVSGDRVYQHARIGNNEVLHCLDLATGETLWTRLADEGRPRIPIPQKITEDLENILLVSQ